MKKLLAVSIMTAAALAVATPVFADGYADITLGEDYTDLETTITVFNHRTDLDSEDYGGVTWKEYLDAFHEMYPGIEVDITTDTNYADDALTHLQSGDYETVMMIPAVDKADLSIYFMSFGDLDTMSGLINYASQWAYEDEVYGIPSTATAQGIVYNKKVFEEAGITELPKTPDEFIDALKKIKENTDAIPLYTNYAAGWTMGAWDAYIGGNATGDAAYLNQKLLHEKDPFRDYGDGTHPYAVYKILYDAVAEGLIEDDYTTTDWEGCKGMINNGQIGCMVLGSWAFTQMRDAGEHGDDIGYMSFPITVNGKQYASAGADYSFGVNVKATYEQKLASLYYIKFLTEQSGFAYSEGGLPIDKTGEYPALYEAFNGIEFVADAPAAEDSFHRPLPPARGLREKDARRARLRREPQRREGRPRGHRAACLGLRQVRASLGREPARVRSRSDCEPAARRLRLRTRRPGRSRHPR